MHQLRVSDVSESAYSAVIYFKTAYDSSHNLHLVTAKSKVAPIKQITLARLELCAALLLSKLVKWVLRSFSKYTFKIYAWCDSTIVLAWLDSHPRKWSNFVANRTSQILEVVPRQNWNHVSSKNNPADLVSRGVEFENLSSSRMWWKGSSWLILSESEWPKNETTSAYQIIPETKTKQITLTTTISTIFDRLCEQFSSFEKIKKSLCVFDRFIRYISGEKQQNQIIGPSELKKAETMLIRWAQNQSYSTEISQLSKAKCIPNSSTLISNLMPYLDESFDYCIQYI